MEGIVRVLLQFGADPNIRGWVYFPVVSIFVLLSIKLCFTLSVSLSPSLFLSVCLSVSPTLSLFVCLLPVFNV